MWTWTNVSAGSTLIRRCRTDVYHENVSYYAHDPIKIRGVSYILLFSRASTKEDFYAVRSNQRHTTEERALYLLLYIYSPSPL
jgi:hypothetical protein